MKVARNWTAALRRVRLVAKGIKKGVLERKEGWIRSRRVR
jgi:hypothetical protein